MYEEDTSLRPFLLPATSPSDALLRQLGALLRTPTSTEWAVVRGGAWPWSQEALRVVSIVVLGLFGNLFLRTIACFNGWPWALLRHSIQQPDEQFVLEQQFERVRPCCVPATDGLTMPLRRIIASGADLRRPDVACLLSDTLDSIPASNIFGRRQIRAGSPPLQHKQRPPH